MYDKPLTNLCTYLKNWFYTGKSIYGTHKVENGDITTQTFLDEIQTNQYFRVVGSVFNDGVYQYDGKNLGMTDEEFVGAIYLMAIPKEVLELATDIDEWTTANKEAINSPYQSESFGGYSYTKASGGANGGSVSWQSQFASRLNRWRKL